MPYRKPGPLGPQCKHPMRFRYAHMIARCHNPAHKQYADYGGRGIAVCQVRGHPLDGCCDSGRTLVRLCTGADPAASAELLPEAV